MERTPKAWDTTFSSWVGEFTVGKLAQQLSQQGEPVTAQAIYGWVSGRRTPRPAAAAAIERISEGRVTVRDVYRHREEKR